MDLGHWTYHEQINTALFCGFVYVITCMLTGMKYIGCKQFRVKSGRGKGYRKPDWQFYTGSNDTLNTQIKKLGKDNFTFQILSLHKTKTELKYQEAKMILAHDAILSPEYFNEWVCLKLRHKKKYE